MLPVCELGLGVISVVAEMVTEERLVVPWLASESGLLLPLLLRAVSWPILLVLLQCRLLSPDSFVQRPLLPPAFPPVVGSVYPTPC